MSNINDLMFKYLTEGMLDDMYKNAEADLTKTLKKKMKDYQSKDMETVFQELTPEMDKIMSKHFLYFMGEIKNKATKILSKHFSPQMAKDFNNAYEKLGTRRLKDR